MKKLLPLLLVLLLLAGCGTDEVTEPSGATESATKSEQQGLYDPASTIEQQTGGAVRVYRLDKNDYFSVSAMGSRLLLRAEDGTMTVLQGETGIRLASLSTKTALVDTSVSFDASVQGAAYYDPESKQVVQVNPQLQEINRLTLPENMQGVPYISMAKEKVYYCVPGEVRALNMQTGVSRLIRSHTYPRQDLCGIWFDGQMLQVSFLNEDRTEAGCAYISSETGKTLSEYADSLHPFYTAGDTYILSRMDGGVRQRVVGNRNGSYQALNITEGRFASALAMGGVIGYEKTDEPTLNYYELKSGKRISSITLPGVSAPTEILTTENAVWILTSEKDQQILCRWDPTATPVKDETVYTGKLFTAADPDVEGLEACQARAEQMSETYGVKIHVWNYIIQQTDGEAVIEPEYQVQTVNRMLDDLTVALEQFPEDFLRKTVEAGWIHVNLVRSVGQGETVTQFWQEGNCYISIAGWGNVTDEFYQGVAYAIDSRVLGNSRKFDDWNDLNPEDFFYSYSYGTHPDRDVWLVREDILFLSEKALAYPHDDRASVFYHAMVGDGSLFDFDVTQAKLEVLCRGIREAYSLEKSPEVYPWEQYLQESLAYTE